MLPRMLPQAKRGYAVPLMQAYAGEPRKTFAEWAAEEGIAWPLSDEHSAPLK